jgi:RNA polymerase sigma-70 factor (ECF subfamily)
MSQVADEQVFTTFVAKVAQPLQQALIAAYGPDVGDDATADALAYAWENWDRIRGMTNPAGYLYRVGQSRANARFRSRPLPFAPSRPSDNTPIVEPGLEPALATLSRKQRAAVVLIHGFGWSVTQVAEMWGVTFSTIQSHLDRGMSKLRKRLGANE